MEGRGREGENNRRERGAEKMIEGDKNRERTGGRVATQAQMKVME